MSIQYSSVSPAEVGMVSGVIGAGIGYTLAPRKYNLEQLLTQKPDVFEKSIDPKLLSKAENTQKIAYNVLKEARENISKAVKNNSAESKLAELLETPKVTYAYKTIKGFLPKARVQTAIILGIIGAFIGTIAKIIYGDK